jgi:Ca-activated chloride channel family protein
MNWISFEYAPALLLLIPLLFCLYRCREKAKQRYFVHLHLFEPGRRWTKLEWLLKVLTLLLLTAALASPIAVDRLDPLNRKGIDLVLCLDGSGSMGASGFEEGSLRSRFEIVQELASAFVMRRIEDNVGVVLYGDFAFVASPVTYEKEIVAQMIGYLSEGMAGQNTAIGEGIAMSLRALERSTAASKAVVLLTDGEQNSGRITPKEAVAIAKEKGVKIYTIGIGGAGEYDEALLGTIAEESGGKSFSAHSRDELEAVYGEIDALERSAIKSREYLKKEYYYPAALLGVFALLLYFIGGRR